MGKTFVAREAVHIGPRRMEIRERNVSAGPSQVVVKVESCGVCAWESRHAYLNCELPYPRALGHEACGTVADVGGNAGVFREGDQVTGLFEPGFATYSVADIGSLVRVPASAALELALGEPLKCVVTNLRAAQMEPGDVVAVVGCGFMGLLVAGALVRNPVVDVVCIDLNEDRLSRAAALGVGLSVSPARAGWLDTVSDVTAGRGVDVAFEASGTPDGFSAAAAVLKEGRGRLVFLSYPNSRGAYDMAPICDKSCSIAAPHPSYSQDPGDDLRRAMRGLEKGAFDMESLITHRFPLSDCSKAMDLCLAPPPGFVKAIVKPWL